MRRLKKGIPMIRTLMTLTIIVVVAAASAWYFIGMPGLEMATATMSDAMTTAETAATAPASPVAP